MNYHIYIDEDVKEQAALAVAQGRMLNLKNDIVFKSFFSKDCEESAYCWKKMLSAVIGRTARNTTGRTQAGVGSGATDAILRRRNRKNRRHHATAA